MTTPPRVVNIHADLHEIKEAIPFSLVEDAIGYLSTWNTAGFAQVDIYADGHRDMVAVYSNPDNDRQYVIGAVWHTDGENGGHYGFHS